MRNSEKVRKKLCFIFVFTNFSGGAGATGIDINAKTS